MHHRVDRLSKLRIETLKIRRCTCQLLAHGLRRVVQDRRALRVRPYRGQAELKPPALWRAVKVKTVLGHRLWRPLAAGTPRFLWRTRVVPLRRRPGAVQIHRY